jgi:formylglycine-generating enzyme required for sulfatase activity/energy-coupling factor transporter ATP-binding protein EcfA2
MVMGKKRTKAGRHTAMRMRKLLQVVFPLGCIIFPGLLHAQQTQSGITLKDAMPWLIAIFIFMLSTIFSVLLVKKTRKAQLDAEMKFKQQRENYESLLEEQKDIKKAQLETELKFKQQEKYIENLKEELKQKKKAELIAEREFKDEEKISASRTAEDIYRAALKEELGHINLLGSPDIESKAVKLEDAFVSLCISQTWRSEERFTKRKEMMDFEKERELPLTPAEAMTRAFKKHRLLLVIGDPGSGKTTLLKYYAVNCLDKKYREFGFIEDVFPIFFPLRELDFNKENNEPTLLPQNLEKWSERHLLNISVQQFHHWLHKRKTLVLLDGLDEISSKEQRQKVCRWIKDMCNGLKNACFVVTSRSTGYRKLDGIELEVPHLRADIMDFSPDQQELFLKKWFRAVFSLELPPKGMREQEWKEKQLKLAEKKSQAIVEFLNHEDNKAVRELAAVPMLLQIMAIIWKEREFLPRTRSTMYDTALNYLLEYRDRQKRIEPVLPAEEARLVLMPTALWMQEELQKDEAPKKDTHEKMQPILDKLGKRPQAQYFCENLRDRAGLIVDYDRENYIFRHKSFREFLSALQLVKDANRENRVEQLVEYFKEDWWEESLRFFMNKSDDEMFDRFMRLFFQSSFNRELNAHQQTLLQNFVREAPLKKIDALKDHLNSDSLDSRQRRYVIDCLKIIGTPDAIKAIENADKSKLDESNLSYLEDIVAEAAGTPEPLIQTTLTKEQYLQDSFRNIFEGNVEYIKIPGATYKYSLSKKMVTVPGLFFCKYPVTNKRYRLFISYLEGKLKNLAKKLPLDIFADRLLEFSNTIKGYSNYLEKDFKQWQSKLRSRYDDDKKFNGDDQPVVGVAWYAARSYCFWLSCLDAVIREDPRVLKGDIHGWAAVYRLPTEAEWEWAAGGNPDGSTRPYPWPEEKGEPNPNLANFNENVGATTPVGRYPEGATPHGLMDMAGNAWEWMENLYQEDYPWPALRGGSWGSNVSSLRCAARVDFYPDFRDDVLGFRVVRPQS